MFKGFYYWIKSFYPPDIKRITREEYSDYLLPDGDKDTSDLICNIEINNDEDILSRVQFKKPINQGVFSSKNL